MPTELKHRGWCYKPGSSIIRGYDTSALFREDCLERIRQLQLGFEADMKRVRQVEKEFAAAEEQLRRRRKEFGWID